MPAFPQRHLIAMWLYFAQAHGLTMTSRMYPHVARLAVTQWGGPPWCRTALQRVSACAAGLSATVKAPFQGRTIVIACGYGQSKTIFQCHNKLKRLQ